MHLVVLNEDHPGDFVAYNVRVGTESREIRFAKRKPTSITAEQATRLAVEFDRQVLREVKDEDVIEPATPATLTTRRAKKSE